MRYIRPKFVLIFLLGLALALLSGCWDEQELDTLFFVTGMGMDAGSEEGTLDMSFQIGKVDHFARGGGASGDKPFFILSNTNSSVLGGIDHIRLDSSRTLYLHHNQMLLISEEVARGGISEHMDFFLRDRETRMEVWVIVSEGSAREILDLEMDQDKVTGMTLSRMMEQRSGVSQALACNLLEVSTGIVENGKTAVVPVVKVLDVDGQADIAIDGMAVFKEGTMVGELDGRLTEGYIWGAGDVNGGTVHVDDGTTDAVFAVLTGESRMEVVISGDTLSIYFDIRAEFAIGEIREVEGEKYEKIMGLLTAAVKAHIEGAVKDCFLEGLGMEVDIFNTGDYLYRNDNSSWNRYKSDWIGMLAEAKVYVNADVDISNSGRFSEPLMLRSE